VRTLAPFLCLLLAGCLVAEGPSAWDLYEEGRTAEKAGKMAQAYLLYSRAAAMEPSNRNYWLRSQSVRSRAALESLQASPQASGVAAGPSGSESGSAETSPVAKPAEAEPVEIAQATIKDRIEARKPLPPTELAAQDGKRDFNLNGDSRKLFEDVAHGFGLDCIFDRDYQNVPAFRFQVTEMDYRDALHALEAATGSFVVPITDKIFLVAKDTPQKRQELEPNVAVELHVDGITVPQDLTALITTVQQTFALERVAWDTQNSTVILRGPISKVVPARAMFEDLMNPHPEVMVEIKLLEASRNDVLTYGVQLPTLIATLPQFESLGNLILSTNSTLIGFTTVKASLVAQLTKGTGRVLLETELRALDGTAATFHAGDRYPIQTSAYIGLQGGVPSITYEDLGLTLKITPTVHSLEDVSLDVEAAVKVLTGQSVNGMPVISHRELKSKVRVGTGEWMIVAGLLNPGESRNLTGIAGLSRIPYLGALLGVREHDKSNVQELILVRPRVISGPPSRPAHVLYVGSDTRPLTQL
jgi:general secretion pathway protein D